MGSLGSGEPRRPLSTEFLRFVHSLPWRQRREGRRPTGASLRVVFAHGTEFEMASGAPDAHESLHRHSHSLARSTFTTLQLPAHSEGCRTGDSTEDHAPAGHSAGAVCSLKIEPTNAPTELPAGEGLPSSANSFMSFLNVPSSERVEGLTCRDPTTSGRPLTLFSASGVGSEEAPLGKERGYRSSALN